MTSCDPPDAEDDDEDEDEDEDDKPAKKKARTAPSTDVQEGRTVFVRNLPAHATQAALIAHFAQLRVCGVLRVACVAVFPQITSYSDLTVQFICTFHHSLHEFSLRCVLCV